MGQNWRLFNLDKHELYYIESDLGESFFEVRTAGNLQALLTRPASSAHMIEYIERKILPGFKPITNQADPESSKSNKSLILEKLPNEILDIICGCIDGLDDITFFALTCPRFWGISKSHIICIRDGLIAENLWAGSRIICLGEEQEPNDWPSSIPGEEYESYISKDDWPDRSDDPRILQFRKSTIFFHMDESERKAWKYICQRYRGASSFILRNMSKKLYVSDEGFDQLFEGCDEKRPKKATLGHAAIAQICWSSNPSTSMSYEGPIHRGQWAGDGLEIVSISQHIREIEATKASQEGLTDTAERGPSPSHATGNECGWKDVTVECMKLIEDIWEADYGNDWRKEAVSPSNECMPFTDFLYQNGRPVSLSSSVNRMIALARSRYDRGRLDSDTD